MDFLDVSDYFPTKVVNGISILFLYLVVVLYFNRASCPQKMAYFTSFKKRKKKAGAPGHQSLPLN